MQLLTNFFREIISKHNITQLYIISRNYIGIDLSEKYIKMAQERLEAESAQMRMW